MSKSHSDERSRILLTDSNENIHKKIKAALTDSEPKISYDPARRPGVSNLIEILSHFEGRPCEELAMEHRSTSLGVFKDEVATSVSTHLQDIREKYFSLIGDRTGCIDSAAEIGAQAARVNTEMTMAQVKQKLGL